VTHTLDKVYVLSTLTLLVDHVGRDRMVVNAKSTTNIPLYLQVEALSAT
jgi:hypothetical protein